MTTFCDYTRITLNATRNIAINWEPNILTIVEMSTTSKEVTLNISNSLINKPIKKNNPEYINLENDLKVEDNKGETTIEDNLLRTAFWTMISRINCVDRDEGLLYKNDILRKFSMREVIFLLEQINNIYIPILKAKLNNVPLLQTIGDENYNNILTHIIVKGKIFYEGIINNPEVSLYLCNQFYPIHDWLSN